MENASKALIIAAAILLAIAIITIGVVVIRVSQSSVTNVNINEQEVMAFNSKFDTYLGERSTANQIRSLMSTINASNASEANGQKRFVTFGNANGSDTKPETYNVTFSSSKTYKIEAVYADSGYIKAITYAEN